MKLGTQLLLMIMVVTSADAFPAEQPRQATVDQPRPFGYVIGDVITQRVRLTSPGLDFQPAEPPPVQRVNIWFERRASRVETDADGNRWLVVDYQLINAPANLATVNLPAWEIEAEAGDARLRIPAASISIAPLISADSSPTADQLRPDHGVSVIDTAPTRTGLVTWSIALGLILAAWLAWARWRNWRDSLDRPFARASHELRRLDESAPEAWQALHRAFDRTAGRVLQIETLPFLFERAPHLQPKRADIERFFAASNERFFGAGLQGDPLSVRTLCQELLRIERRHAS